MFKTQVEPRAAGEWFHCQVEFAEMGPKKKKGNVPPWAYPGNNTVELC